MTPQQASALSDYIFKTGMDQLVVRGLMSLVRTAEFGKVLIVELSIFATVYEPLFDYDNYSVFHAHYETSDILDVYRGIGYDLLPEPVPFSFSPNSGMDGIVPLLETLQTPWWEKLQPAVYVSSGLAPGGKLLLKKPPVQMLCAMSKLEVLFREKLKELKGWVGTQGDTVNYVYMRSFLDSACKRLTAIRTQSTPDLLTQVL